MNAFIPVVNQRRVYAELLLAQARDCTPRHLQRALLESTVFQLECAYRLYLGEIAATYRSRQPEAIHTLLELVADLQGQGKTPAETEELSELCRRPDSWLSQLQACAASFASLPETLHRPPAVDAAANRIPALSSVERFDWSTLDTATVERWLSAFNELLNRHRETMVEW